jgi:NAD dependent epimerase/dehydratase
MSLKHKKIVVTGASGFIGSHLVERLVTHGARVCAFLHYNSRNDLGLLALLDEAILREVEIITGDLLDQEAVRTALKDREIVFHLGALVAIPYSYLQPLSFVQTNILGTAHVLNAALAHGIERLIHTSTSEVYGTAQYHLIDEKHPLVAQSPYAASKIAADKLVESYHFSFGLPVATIRPFNTYGARQSARAVIPTIIAQALSQDVIRLGATFPRRDFTYISDTIEGFLRIAECDRAIGEVVNLGSGKAVSINEVVTRVGAILGRSLPILSEPSRLRPVHSEVGVLAADNHKAATLLGWQPTVSLEEGLRKTLDWIDRHLSSYKAERYHF